VPSLQIISIALEVLIALLALRTAIRGQFYMVGLAFTFSVYVFYDLARHYTLSVPAEVLSILFFAATLSALYSVWCIYRRRHKP
jgi:hypothetical protein